MVHIKSKREIELMRKSGSLVAQVLSRLAEEAKAGVKLIDLDRMAEEMTLGFGAKPSFKGYHGFQHSLCTSVNEQVVHGVPSQRSLKDGDILGLDFGLILNGFHGDSALTVPIGNISESSRTLLETTRDALYAGIDASRAGNTLKDVARAIESVAKRQGYSIVREFVGHGIGQKLHEEPQVANFEAGASNLRLKPGMAICIEPMVNQGTAEVQVLTDGWTTVTKDGALSAHYEHTLVITDGDPEVLTEWAPPRFESILGRLNS